MVLLQSQPADIGARCVDFSLPSVDNKRYSLKDFDGSKALLIAFICNHCPYVRAIEDRLISLAKTFAKKDFQLVGICSNDSKRYPDDSPAELHRRWQQKSYGFPYLIDEDQSVAKAFGAVCTPDLFLYDQKRHLFYHGRLDNDWQNEANATEHDMREAVQAIIDERSPPPVQHPSMGCSIKWR